MRALGVNMQNELESVNSDVEKIFTPAKRISAFDFKSNEPEELFNTKESKHNRHELLLLKRSPDT